MNTSKLSTLNTLVMFAYELDNGICLVLVVCNIAEISEHVLLCSVPKFYVSKFTVITEHSVNYLL